MTDEIEAVALKLRSDLDEATKQHMPAMVVTTYYLRAVLDTNASLRAGLARAEERGVRMGIEAAAGTIRNDVFAEAQDTEWDTGFNYAKKLAVSMVLHLYPAAIIRALDAEAIAKGITTADALSELAAADAVLLDLPARRVEDWTQNFTRGDSDGDDGS